MDKKKLNTSIDFELINGDTVPLTISWGLLYQVRSKSKADYERYSKMVSAGVKDDVLGYVTIIYMGYLCAYIQQNGKPDGAMSEKDFLDLVPNDMELVVKTANALLSPKR